MAEYQVTCINKPDRLDIHSHITHIGNLAAHWRMTREEAISRIDANTDAFFTVDRNTGKKMYIAVIRETGKVPFLRTHADGKWNDNLLALSECGTDCKLVG